MKVYLLMLIGLFAGMSSFAQYDNQNIFSDKTGNELRLLLIQEYKPGVVLTYGEARDIMYGKIYNVNDSVAGIYSDHKVYLKPGEDPSTYIFQDGAPNGINAEHSYPQSKGAGDGNARSDMHHLFPSRVSTNSARGSLPFGEISDNITQTWYYKTQENSNKPNTSSIDLYSEKGNEKWEPRESVKGNIARAIFYFYTMYQDQADNADPTFFNGMKETLCDWHEQDPVDELEWKRSHMIAPYQDGRNNPFVLDCSLAFRMYCGDISPSCQLVELVESEIEINIELMENPVYDFATFKIHSTNTNSEKFEFQLFSLYGQKLVSGTFDGSQSTNISIPLDNLPTGMYIINWFVENKSVTSNEGKPFVIIKM